MSVVRNLVVTLMFLDWLACFDKAALLLQV